jgi:hypothetical protein
MKFDSIDWSAEPDLPSPRGYWPRRKEVGLDPA